MKLTFNIICEETIDRLGVKPLFYRCSDDENGIIAIGSTGDESYAAELIYVLENEAVQSFPANCIIIGERLKAPENTSCMVLPDGTDRAKIVSALNAVFVKYERWQNELIEQIASGADWYTIVDTAHNVLRNPIIIYDAGMKVLSYTVNDGSDDELWRDTVTSGIASTGNMHESEELLKYVRRFESDNRPFKHKGENMTDPFYSCNILVQGKRSGMVCLMEHNHEISRGETDFLRIFCSILTLKMQSDRAESVSREDLYRLLLVDLLEGNILNPQRLNTRLVAAGWSVQKYFVVMQFSRSLSYIRGAQWRMAMEDFGRLGLDGICCMLNEDNPVICAVSSLKNAEQMNSIEGKLRSYCETNHLRCGISDVFDDLIQVPRYWDQAVSALELGFDTVTEYGSVRMKKLMEHLNEHRSREDILSREVLKLRETDEREGTEYCATLKALCESLFRQTEAADRLSIHRTTLTYRMQKISEITELDMTKPDMLLHAWLTLKILDESK